MVVEEEPGRGIEVTREHAWRALELCYSAGTIYDDPEWVEEMVDALMENPVPEVLRWMVTRLNRELGKGEAQCKT